MGLRLNGGCPGVFRSCRDTAASHAQAAASPSTALVAPAPIATATPAAPISSGPRGLGMGLCGARLDPARKAGRKAGEAARPPATASTSAAAGETSAGAEGPTAGPRINAEAKRLADDLLGLLKEAGFGERRHLSRGPLHTLPPPPCRAPHLTLARAAPQVLLLHDVPATRKQETTGKARMAAGTRQGGWRLCWALAWAKRRLGPDPQGLPLGPAVDLRAMARTPLHSSSRASLARPSSRALQAPGPRVVHNPARAAEARQTSQPSCAA
jgi:hypothetical protein